MKRQEIKNFAPYALNRLFCSVYLVYEYLTWHCLTFLWIGVPVTEMVPEISEFFFVMLKIEFVRLELTL